ncbi:MAG: ATP-binding protein [Acidobacteriota bacterium]|nr:ATP-binding protein [Acidobacteriota bacterium]
MRERWSISLRLAFWFGSFFFIGWLLFGVAMWFNLSATLTTERDLTLSRRIDRFQEMLSNTQNEVEAKRLDDFLEFSRATGNGLNEVFALDGTREFKSSTAAAKKFPWPLPTALQAEQYSRIRRGEQSYRVLLRPCMLGGRKLVLACAAPETGNQLVLNRFLVGLMASVPVVLLLASGGGYLVSRKALRPVDEIARSVQSISIGNLSERLPLLRSRDELQRLTETSNAMLERLESSVLRIRQFTADASHELRAPLSIILTASEVALCNPQLDAQTHKAFRGIVEEAEKATALLNDMLTLARADAAHGDLLWEPVDLTSLAADMCEKARPRAEQRGLTLAVSIPASQPVTVMGDVFALRRLLWTLMDNALKYTPNGGSVGISLTAAASSAVVEVTDSGIGIADKDLPFIFDRFYRADPSRSSVEGTGLGLAIAKWIAQVHKAELTARSEPGHGSTFRVVFPSAL